MFTSRAEHRLLLRQNNADERMFTQAEELGIVDEERKATFYEKKENKNKILKTLKNTKTKINNETKTAEQLCKRNDFSENQIKTLINESSPLFTYFYYDVS